MWSPSTQVPLCWQGFVAGQSLQASASSSTPSQSSSRVLALHTSGPVAAQALLAGQVPEAEQVSARLAQRPLEAYLTLHVEASPLTQVQPPFLIPSQLASSSRTEHESAVAGPTEPLQVLKLLLVLLLASWHCWWPGTQRPLPS